MINGADCGADAGSRDAGLCVCGAGVGLLLPALQQMYTGDLMYCNTHVLFHCVQAHWLDGKMSHSIVSP